MKKLIFSLIFLASSALSSAQYASDIYRFSNAKTNGTSRFQSLGGNHAAIGADASNLVGNPAGLGFYGRSELSVGFGLNTAASASQYIDNGNSNSTKTDSKLNSLSLVISRPQRGKSLKRTSWGISYQRINDLNRNFSFSGTNKASSLIDYYVSRANDLNITQKEFNDNIDKSGFVGKNDLDIADASLFYQGYLINPSTDEGRPYFRFDENASINQSGTFDAKGGTSQWGVGYAENYNNKFYWGMSAVFTNLNYTTNYNFKEANSPAQVFNGFEFKERLEVVGTGLGVNAGFIYKLSDVFQIGANYQSPFFLTAREGFIQSLSIDPRNIPASGGGTIKPDFLDLETEEDVRNLDYRSPAKFNLGTTMFLPNKKGFLTGTIEYVTNNRMRARINDAYFNPDNFNSDIKNDILRDYKPTVNVRVGAEINVSKIKLRGGVAYIPSALKNMNDNINRNQVVLSGGVGLRNSAYFIDAGVNWSATESAFTPYKLANTRDYSSVSSQNTFTNLNFTVGRFF